MHQQRWIHAEADRTALEMMGEASVDLQAAGEGEGAKQPTFSILAYAGGALRLLGWPYPVVVDLAGLRAEGPVAALMDHDRTQIVGQGVATISARQIKLVGKITGDWNDKAEPAGKVVLHARNGFQWPVSIGASVEKLEFVEDGVKVSVNGKSFTGPLYVQRAGRLGEVSFLSIGADGTASATVAASAAGETNMDFEVWVKAKGFEADKLSETQRSSLRVMYDAEIEATAGGGPAPVKDEPKKVDAGQTVDIMAAAELAVKQERQRMAQIEAACQGLPAEKVGELKAKAASGEISFTQLQAGLLELLRSERPKAPAMHVVQGPESTRVLEAAMVLRHNLGDEKKLLAQYGEQTLNQADRFRKLGLRKLVEICASMTGIELPLSVDSEYIRAAFSNQALSGILGAVANKALEQSFTSTRAVIPMISRAVSHNNFHQHTVYSLALNGDIQEVAGNGELKHLDLSEESYTRQLQTRGALLSITRKDMIDDELGAFVENGMRVGRKCIVGRERVGFLALNATGAGASFFTTAHANYISGASTNLQHSSLGTAVQAFRDQTGPDGDPVMIEPKILLVPSALEETAMALMDPSFALIATALGSTSAAKREPSKNVWAGKFQPIASEWLGKTIGTQAGSSTAWYLFADPADVPVMEVSYLNGQQQPTVEFFGLDQNPNVLGVTWRCFWDFGVDLAEYRAGVKSKGAA